MRKQEWIFTLALAGLGMMVANFIGFDVAFSQSLPGVLVLLVISAAAAFLSWLIPLKLPTVAYCSILGLLCACPISPISEFVIQSVGQINFTAPLTMVGAFAGMSISNQIKQFVKQGWKMIVISVLVMTGTFFGSLVIAQVMLQLTGTI
ncbi:MAG: hypothetical protein K2P10_03415 [Oscillospiraceae bacterium]|jgi:hypothetical protein|nr:hypothetical protein [Oscillospiraceae bacterium]MDE6932144.1 hypothetical protein [Oscillospiraceae bacterium]MDE7041820.1 hypothetical protein [Oscillospiraceae bacterium]